MDGTIVIDLEKKLLRPQNRRDPTILSDLLDDAFVEFGSSGKIFDKRAIMNCLSNEDQTEIVASDFLPVQLGPDLIQVRFKTHSRDESGSVEVSLRSSIWKRTDETWRLVFHQGTLVSG